MPVEGTHTIFYDGVCGLCDRFVQLVLKRDVENQFRFAPLQGEYAQRVLSRFGVEVELEAPLQTVYVLTAGGRLLERSDAALFVFERLPGTSALAKSAAHLPRGLRDLGYRVVAKTRFSLFGRRDSCAVPSLATRSKFIDDSAD